MPQMVEVDPGDNRGEQIGKTIGSILDWAVIVLPVVGGAKVATTAAAKATTTAVKAAQAVQTVSKLSRLQRAGTAVLKGYQNLRKSAERSNAPVSLLEWLTMERWGQQIGRNFDRPPRREEDRAYREEYNRNKSRMEEELRRKKEAIYERQVALGVFRTEQAKKQARIESLQVSEQELSQTIAQHEQEWRENAREKARQEWKEAWAADYRVHMKDTLMQEVTVYLDALPERLEKYQEGRFRPLLESIAAKQRAYDDLDDISEGEAAEKLVRVRRIMDELKMVCA